MVGVHTRGVEQSADCTMEHAIHVGFMINMNQAWEAVFPL